MPTVHFPAYALTGGPNMNGTGGSAKPGVASGACPMNTANYYAAQTQPRVVPKLPNTQTYLNPSAEQNNYTYQNTFPYSDTLNNRYCYYYAAIQPPVQNHNQYIPAPPPPSRSNVSSFQPSNNIITEPSSLPVSPRTRKFPRTPETSPVNGTTDLQYKNLPPESANHPILSPISYSNFKNHNDNIPLPSIHNLFGQVPMNYTSPNDWSTPTFDTSRVAMASHVPSSTLVKLPGFNSILKHGKKHNITKPPTKQKSRSYNRLVRSFNSDVTMCTHCKEIDTPEWRRGPDGCRTLCNACGIFYRKLLGRFSKEEANLKMQTQKLINPHDRRIRN
ncbi:hypothetical protein NCAS_0D01260 [Naumovozyma castellii]|uniref:GATA-type domain-containing protein n=1 Tax=Naumovozyma castellii TaxID=27288 RepID=G0VDR8_NAUCA|nr:hypothetical protein NCAS_0D01260 [Naumovozyma castellii CBS 4309]CCC69707.1 hypothetical protein NCAS_0D01260 [Naumovozyma castellii CBS 4309]